MTSGKPVARATENSKIWVGYSGLFGNAGALFGKDTAVARKGANVIEADPKLAADYRVQPGSPLEGKGDPSFGGSAASPSVIGLR